MTRAAPTLAALWFQDAEPARGTLSHVVQYRDNWRAVLRGYRPPGRTRWPAEGASLDVDGINYTVRSIEEGVSFEPTAFIIVLTGDGVAPPSSR